MKSRFPIVELGKHIRQVSQRNRAAADIEVFSVTNSEGFTRSTDYFSKEVFSKDVSNYKIVSPGQFAYNPSRINVGSIDYLRHVRPVLVSPLYVVFEGNKGIHVDYLLRYLKSDWGNAQIRANTEGAVRDSLKFKGLESIKIPLPLCDDQIRIAYLLGKAEGLIAQRKHHLQQLEDLLKSVFLEMFGDPVRNEKGWDRPTLKAFGKISTGNTPARNDSSNYDEPHIEWIKTDNIATDSVFVSTASEYLSDSGARRARTVSKGALLVACIAGSVESIGRAALTDRTVAFNQQINAIQPAADVNPLFLYGLFKLSRSYIQSHATKGMKKILTKGDFEQIPMIKPPIDSQNQFAALVEKVNGLKSNYQQSLTDLEALYGALSQQAFKGELDLSRVPLPADQCSQIHCKQVERQADQSSLPVETVTPSAVINNLVQVQQPQGRSDMLARWFSQYLTNILPDASLGSAQLLEAAWQTLQEAQLEDEGETPALTLDDYDALKDWVFKKLASSELSQTFDGGSNRVALQRQSADWGTW